MGMVDLVCAVCGVACTKPWIRTRPQPRYCSIGCANRDRKDLPKKASWRKYTFDASMNAAIRKAAASKYGSLTTLWETDVRFAASGIPYAIVRRQAWLLGCVRSTPTTAWSQAEHDLCATWYLQGRSAEAIAKLLRRHGYDRTIGGVASRMHAMQIQRKMADFFTVHDLATGLNVEDKVVRRWVANHGLPVHHTSDGLGQVLYLEPRAMRRWILEHIGLVAKVSTPDLVWYTALLVPQAAGVLDQDADPVPDGEWMSGEAIRDVACAGLEF